MTQDPRLNKFQKLNETFQIAERTINELNDFDDIDDSGKAVIEYNPDVYAEGDLLNIKMLKEDLHLIRSVLLSNVQKGKLIIDAISRDIAESGAFSDSKMIEALSSLIKNTNSSLKDLSSIFKDLYEIENSKKNKPAPASSETGTTNTQNNIFVGNAKDILEMLSNK